MATKKSEFISRKIKKLRDEGMPQKQAVAVAHSYWKRNKAKRV